MFFEHDVFDENTNPALDFVDFKLNNATSIGGSGAYTQYSIMSPMSLQAISSTIAAVIGGKTFRTPLTSLRDRLPICDDA
jgi:hypothetical protein